MLKPLFQIRFTINTIRFILIGYEIGIILLMVSWENAYILPRKTEKVED